MRPSPTLRTYVAPGQRYSKADGNADHQYHSPVWSTGNGQFHLQVTKALPFKVSAWVRVAVSKRGSWRLVLTEQKEQVVAEVAAGTAFPG